MINLYFITALLILPNIQATLRLHSFYALENTDVVSQSQSIQLLNKCKDDCLKMGKFFPFKFKYHRYILRQKVGRNKYFQGTCHFAIPDEDTWYDWEQLQIFISKTTTNVDMSEQQRWINFKDQCEDKTLKMDEDNLRNLGFERVHSNFEYFDDGTFNNLSPFTDIDSLMGEVSNFIS